MGKDKKKVSESNENIDLTNEENEKNGKVQIWVKKSEIEYEKELKKKRGRRSPLPLTKRE